VGIEKHLLHEVGRIEFPLKAFADLDAREQSQVTPIEFEQATEVGGVASASLKE